MLVATNLGGKNWPERQGEAVIECTILVLDVAGEKSIRKTNFFPFPSIVFIFFTGSLSLSLSLSLSFLSE